MSVNHIKTHETKGGPSNPFGNQPIIKLIQNKHPPKCVGDNDDGWMISSYLLSISLKSEWCASNSKLIIEKSFWKKNRNDLIGSRRKIFSLYIQRSTHFIHFYIWLTWHFQKIYMVSDKTQNTIDFFIRSIPRHGVFDAVWSTGATLAKRVNKMSNLTPTYKQPKEYNTSEGIGR